MVKKLLIIIAFIFVIIGVPVGAWALSHVVHGLPCCPWSDLLDATLMVAPFSLSIGVLAALIVTSYQRLLKAIERLSETIDNH